MATNSKNVISWHLNIRKVSFYFVAGVLLAAFCPLYGTGKYAALSGLSILICYLTYKCPKEWIFLFCGIFVFMLFTISSHLSVPEFAINIGNKFGNYIDALPLKRNYLVKAFLSGNRQDVPNEIIELFRKSGSSHLLALSGFHMGILYFMLDILMKPISKMDSIKVVKYVIMVFLAVFYTLIVGAKPSIVRACLFIVIRESCHVFGYKTSAVNILCLALLIQLALSPDMIKSIGFQLSYLAVAGIIFVGTKMEKWVSRKKRILHYIWVVCCIAISCQLFTIPLVYYYFGSIPKYFLVANLIVVPICALFIEISIVCLVLTSLSICPQFVYHVTDWIGDLMIFSLQVIGTI